MLETVSLQLAGHGNGLFRSYIDFTFFEISKVIFSIGGEIVKAILNISTVLAVILLLFVTFGCFNDNSTGLSESESAVVSGLVVAVEDLVPVDGGVTIDLECLNGRTERLLFPSLFTNPPPSEETLELYQVILRIKRGNLVRAEGTRTESGIELERLTILSN